MSATLEIQFNEFNDSQCAMFLRLSGKEATKEEVRTARAVIDLLTSGAIATGAKEIASQDLDRPDPITSGKN